MSVSSLADLGIYSVREYGAHGDGINDDRAAFLATIAAAGNGIVLVPPGVYRMAGNLPIRRRIHMIGAGGTGTSDTTPLEVSTSILAFDPGFSLVLDSNTSSSGSGSAAGSCIEDLAIKQHANESSGTHVVEQRARATWKSCTLYAVNGGGHGWNVTAGNHENTQSLWLDCHVRNTGGDGWHLEVGNSNIFGGSASNCVGRGVCIANVFGCLVAGTRCLGCGIGADISWQLTGSPGSEDGQGQHVAVGCSASGGQGKIWLGQSSTWLGGPSSEGLTLNSRGKYLPSGANWSPIIVSNALSGITITCTVGVGNTGNIAYQWQSSDDPQEFRLHYDATTLAQRWLARWMGNPNGAYELTATGHAEGAGNLLLPRGYFLGSGNSRRFFTTGPAAPTTASPRASGNWAEGDTIFNDRTNSANDSVKEWVCTGAGSSSTAVWTPHNL